MRAFSIDELNCIEKQNSTVAHMIIFQCYTGLSTEQLCSIKRDDVDPDELVIQLSEIDNQTISIPSETTKMIIGNYWFSSVYKSIYLFANKDGSRINPIQYEKEFKCMMAILGMRHIVDDTKKTYLRRIETNSFSLCYSNNIIGS